MSDVHGGAARQTAQQEYVTQKVIAQLRKLNIKTSATFQTGRDISPTPAPVPVPA
jgi:hypothetical protein